MPDEKEKQTRFASQAPPPIKLVSGTGGFVPPDPRPTRIPPKPPDFPSDFWPETKEILKEACYRFPTWKWIHELLELCKFVVSEMPRVFCGSVKAKTIKAQRALIAVDDLLYSFLVCNDPHPRSSDLSDEAKQIKWKARKSDEWQELVRTIEEAQRLSTRGKQEEHPGAQNSGKTTTKGVETKPAGRVPSERTYERVRAVADLAKKLESPMSQMSKSERRLKRSDFESQLKSVGITDSADIDLVRNSNTPQAAAIAIMSRRKGLNRRTLQNTVSRVKVEKA